jgi:hypothetical protein
MTILGHKDWNMKGESQFPKNLIMKTKKNLKKTKKNLKKTEGINYREDTFSQ